MIGGIGKIKNRLGKGLLFTDEHVQFLLSFLEKEEQAHTMSVFDLNMKIAELGIALEKEKERVEQLEKAIDEWTKLYHSLQEHADKLGEIITNQTSKRLELEERAKELESKEVALKAVIDKFKKGSEGREKYYEELESNLQKLEAELKKYKEKYGDYSET